MGILYGISTLFSGVRGLAIAAILAGLVFLLLFVRPLASRPFRVGLLINMLSLIIIFAMNIIMPIFIQSALSASSLAASLTLFPAILLSCVAVQLAGHICDRRGAGGLLLSFNFTNKRKPERRSIFSSAAPVPLQTRHNFGRSAGGPKNKDHAGNIRF